MSKQMGFDIFRIVDDEECFQTTRRFLASRARTVLEVLISAVYKLNLLFSHIKFSHKLDSRGSLIIYGKITHPCPLEHKHLAQLVVVAVVQRLCLDVDKKVSFVFERVEMVDSQYRTKVKITGFGHPLPRRRNEFSIRVRSDILNCPVGGWVEADPVVLNDIDVADFEEAVLALAPGLREDATAVHLTGPGYRCVRSLERAAEPSLLTLREMFSIGRNLNQNEALTQRYSSSEKRKTKEILSQLKMLVMKGRNGYESILVDAFRYMIKSFKIFSHLNLLDSAAIARLLDVFAKEAQGAYRLDHCFTPWKVIQPEYISPISENVSALGSVIVDPAAGTGGFLSIPMNLR